MAAKKKSTTKKKTTASSISSKRPAPAQIEKVRALLARAADPGATEEERRTSASIAAKLIREYGIEVGHYDDAHGLRDDAARVGVHGVRPIATVFADALKERMKDPRARRALEEFASRTVDSAVDRLLDTLFPPRR